MPYLGAEFRWECDWCGKIGKLFEEIGHPKRPDAKWREGTGFHHSRTYCSGCCEASHEQARQESQKIANEFLKKQIEAAQGCCIAKHEDSS